jgi:hypothetical protein
VAAVATLLDLYPAGFQVRWTSFTVNFFTQAGSSVEIGRNLVCVAFDFHAVPYFDKYVWKSTVTIGSFA